MRFQVYGISDDLLVIEEIDEYGRIVQDGFHAEFAIRYGDLVDEPNYIGFSDGTLLRVSYDGFWHIVSLERGKCHVEHRAATDIEDDYSDILTLNCPEGFAWIVEGKDMKRLSGQLDFFVS